MLWANEVHPRLDNVRQVGACLGEHIADLAQGLLRLRVRVVAADDGTRAVNGSGPGHEDQASRSNGTGEADDGGIARG